MRNFKKIISVFISVALLMCVPSAVFASDYEGHWCKEVIETFLMDGTISGDESGNVNPDAPITRAEFAKIINKTFRFTAKAEQNYSDVPEDAWYFDELLIAKEAGYMQGDGTGLVRPEDPLTRAEVCVILARVLNLNTSDLSLAFKDAGDIPGWAAGYIAALVRAGYILGYTDNTFKADNRITRAESFSVIGSYRRSAAQNAVSSGVGSGNTAAMPAIGTVGGTGGGGGSFSGGSSGGGGGGGGGGSQSAELNTPVIKISHGESQSGGFDESITWNPVSNATGYQIIVSVEGEGERTVNVTGTEFDLTGTITEIIGGKQELVFNITVKIKAVGGSSFGDSAYTSTHTFQRQYKGLNTPVLSLKSKEVGGTNRAVVFFDSVEDATSYEGEFFINGAKNNTMEYDEPNNAFIIPDTSVIGDDEAYVKVRAISTDPNIYSSEYAQIAVTHAGAVGDGTVANPYQLKAPEDFDLVRNPENQSKHFVVVNDIVLGNFTPLPEFKGSLKSIDDKSKTLTVNISKQSDYTGLFEKLGAGAAIDNITIAGTVSGTGYLGAIAGASSGACKITNCTNMATVTGTSGRVGGIIGESYQAAVDLTGCVNVGNVSSTNLHVGGITGVSTAATVLSKCVNLGNVSGTSNTGGITGEAYGNVTYSYNSGNVTTTGTNADAAVGGISGRHRQAATKYCFNTGTITGGGYAGGIAGGLNANGNSTITLDYCYNAGTVNGSTGSDPLVSTNYRRDAIATAYTVTNSFYLNSQASQFGTALSDAELQNKNNENVEKLLANGFTFSTYKYPTITSVPFITKDDFVIWNSDPGISASFSSGTLTFNWSGINVPNAQYIEVTVVNNYNLVVLADKEQIGTGETSYTLSDCTPGTYYEIQLRLLSAGGKSSTAVTYEHLAQ